MTRSAKVLSQPHFSMTLRGHASLVKSAAFSPDGHWLASGGDDQVVHLWNIAEPTAQAQLLEGHSGTIWSLAFSPAGEWLASGAADQTVRL
jgi:WD40 repeat protein